MEIPYTLFSQYRGFFVRASWCPRFVLKVTPPNRRLNAYTSLQTLLSTSPEIEKHFLHFYQQGSPSPLPVFLDEIIQPYLMVYEKGKVSTMAFQKIAFGIPKYLLHSYIQKQKIKALKEKRKSHFFEIQLCTRLFPT